MCYTPFFKKTDGVYFPCGKCPKCIARRVSAWSFRLQQEEKVSTRADFITLTYDTRHVPINTNGQLTLCKRDLQLFHKRLRKSQSGNSKSPIKYYAVGEYGGRTRRPHYHIILFNAKLELINDAWNKGDIHYGQVTGASIGYCLKYMSKQKKKFRISADDIRLPEFALMSKGLGKNYIEDKQKVEWHFADILNRMYCVTTGGVKLSMPRYYKDKLYFDQERRNIAAAYEIINHQKQMEKFEKQTFKSIRAEQAAIDAAFDRMYKSSLKTCI